MSKFSKVRQWVKERGKVVSAGLVCAGAGLLASATPPTMPEIDLPVDGASVVTAIITLGVAVLLLAWGAIVGFRLARKLIKRLAGAV